MNIAYASRTELICRQFLSLITLLLVSLFALHGLPVRAQCVPSPPGLVSLWRAEGNANDSYGYNNGTLYNGVTFAPGKVGQAFDFDGQSARISVEDDASLKITSSLTIETWLNVRSADDAGFILFRGDNRPGLDPYVLAIEPGSLLRFHIESLTEGVDLDTPITLNQWHHVAAVLEDATNTMRIYIDGTLVAQELTSVRPFRDLDPGSVPGIGIGNHGGYPDTPYDYPYDGLIDELSLYNRALTGAEIAAIYHAGSAGKCLTLFSISGHVTDSAGVPLAGVTVARTGSVLTTTDSHGDYRFTSLRVGTYTVAPRATGYIFNPASRAATVQTGSARGIDFVGLRPPFISGRVATRNGVGVPGVRILRTNSRGTVTSVLTNANGYYGFSSVPRDTYTLTPRLSGFSFTPPSLAGATTGTSNIGNVNFTALQTPVIGGRVTTSGGVGIANLSLTLVRSGTSKPMSVMTDAHGYYSLSSLTPGTYTITPESSQYSFMPPSHRLTLSAGADDQDVNFIGIMRSIPK